MCLILGCCYRCGWCLYLQFEVMQETVSHLSSSWLDNVYFLKHYLSRDSRWCNLFICFFSYSVSTGPFDHFQEQLNITVDSGRHEALTLTALLVLPECQGYSAQWWGTNSLSMIEDSEISIGSLELKETTEVIFWWRKENIQGRGTPETHKRDTGLPSCFKGFEA